MANRLAFIKTPFGGFVFFAYTLLVGFIVNSILLSHAPWLLSTEMAKPENFGINMIGFGTCVTISLALLTQTMGRRSKRWHIGGDYALPWHLLLAAICLGTLLLVWRWGLEPWRVSAAFITACLLVMTFLPRLFTLGPASLNPHDDPY